MIQPDRTKLLVLLFGLMVSGCEIGPSTGGPSPTQAGLSQQDITRELTTTQMAGEANSENSLTNLIGDILADPGRYHEESVEVVGYYRGWDVLHETQKAPPVTRSDWVIADASGAIYVTGLTPPGLDPASPADTQTIIRLAATVQYVEQNKTVYLRADRVEIVRD